MEVKLYDDAFAPRVIDNQTTPRYGFLMEASNSRKTDLQCNAIIFGNSVYVECMVRAWCS